MEVIILTSQDGAGKEDLAMHFSMLNIANGNDTLVIDTESFIHVLVKHQNELFLSIQKVIWVRPTSINHCIKILHYIIKHPAVLDYKTTVILEISGTNWELESAIQEFKTGGKITGFATHFHILKGDRV